MQNMDDYQNFEFTSFKDFENWKSKEESITNTRFVKAAGDKKYKGYITKNFYCHRSGKYVSQGTGKRHMKLQGSNKINSRCPAKITVKCFETGNVSVRYLARHEGHTNDTSHLFIRKEQRQQIAERLSLGVPFNAVIDHIRKEAGDDVSLQLITKQDLKNIYRDYRLDNSIFHQNECQSVKAWVNMGYADCAEVECIEDECVQKDNIETSKGSTDENLQDACFDEFNLFINENKDNPACLSMLLASLKNLRAQARVFQNIAHCISTNITK